MSELLSSKLKGQVDERCREMQLPTIAQINQERDERERSNERAHRSSEFFYGASKRSASLERLE